MKSMMKKIAASLTAILMMIQIVPAFGETYSSGMIARIAFDGRTVKPSSVSFCTV